MNALADIVERMRALLFRGRAEREMDDELRFHIEREVQERVKHGADPAEARREAMAAFGGVERVKDDVREARGVQPLEELMADLRFAVRALRHNLGFTAAVVTVLGLGIGATAAVFTVVDTVLLAELPYPGADRLVRIVVPPGRPSMSVAEFHAIRNEQHTLEAFGLSQRSQAALTGAGAPERITLGRATSGYLATFSLTAEQGRLIEETDELPGAPPVAVVSHGFAERTFGSVEGAVGRAITLDGVSHTVIGVLLPGRERLPGLRSDVWAAYTVLPATRRGPFGRMGIGRVREGLSIEDATADLAAISRRLNTAWPDWRDTTAMLTPVSLRRTIVGTSYGPVRLFGLAVALVLLVAVANVATLLLVRASARSHEVAVRAALGASRARLSRLVITECALLTLLATAVGLVIAMLGIRAVPELAPNLPRLPELAFGLRTWVFLLVSAALSGTLISLSPVSAVLAGTGATGKPGDTRSGASRQTNRVRGILVATEFALALPLLLGAGLLLNSFLRLQQVDLGFRPEGALAVQLSLPRARYPEMPDRQALFHQAQQLVAALPGVTQAGMISALPPDNGGSSNNFNLVDKPVADGEREPYSPWMAVTPGLFAALGVPLLDGRLFTDADSGNGPPVVLVSRSWAERYYPRENAVGKQLVSGGCYNCPRTTIIGIVGDVKYDGIAGTLEAFYDPLTQMDVNSMFLIVRTRESPPAMFQKLRQVLGGLDAELAVTETTLEDQVDEDLADPGRWTAVLGGFAAAAVLLAALGIFGLMSYIVRQRRREIGVRLALGAAPSSLTWLIVGRGMRYALIGTAVGFALALLEGRWLAALLYGVSPMDPTTVVTAAVVLLAIALLACWLPGLRAARIRPVEVLSAE